MIVSPMKGSVVIAFLFLLLPGAFAQHIELRSGGGYLTFFYEPNNDRMDVVFRAGGGASASGLANPYGEPPGGVGGSSSDFVFSSLLLDLSFIQSYDFGGLRYMVTPVSSSAGYRKPALGINTRLREGEAEQNQFESLRWTLKVAESTIPDGAEVVVYLPGQLVGEYRIALSTASGILSYDFPNWAQEYWHWGFTHQGDYSLVFEVEGVGGEYGDFLARTQLRVDFRVQNRWQEYPVGIDMTVNARALGPLYLGNRPWIYSYLLGEYMYIREEEQVPGGTWIYVPDPVD